MKRKKYYILFLAFAVSAIFSLFAHAQTVGTVGITLPSAPTGLAATVVPPSQISLSWAAATESSGTIEGYYVYRNGARITTTSGASLIDSGLTSGVYIYTIAAYDADGNVSAQSSPVSATLFTYTTPPSTPAGVTITGTTSTNSSYATTTLTISWSASTDVIGVAGYNVYRNGISIVSSTLALTGTSITDSVPPGTYVYTVMAYDAAQNFSNRSTPIAVTISADTTPPSAPTGVLAQQISSTGVNLTWATSTDNVGVAGYQVFRDGTQIASTTSPAYSDTGLSQNITYAYVVKAYDIAGNISGPSIPINTVLQLTTGPIPPYAFSAALLGTSTVKLSWAPVGGILAVTGYTIYRNDVSIATVSSTNYLDEGLAPGPYIYGVTATDISGAVSPTSSPANIVVPVMVSTPASVTTTPVVTASSSSTAPLSVASGTSPAPVSAEIANSAAITQLLYFGLRSAQVGELQSLLAAQGYLTSANATGFFGNLTLSALQKFQCDQNIVCTGGAGWGTVGPKTRAVLNNLQKEAVSSGILSTSSTSDLNTEIQALHAELANLEKQISQ